ncbi:sulfurtransferase [Clostridium sp. D2Q-11]|uniref:Sulfurtransferase n=1 Tax=Anaeromonas frigoriresistens TaxID=2683708 RepID=A0A942UT06_9FIRM|nr:sulfurtransferase [Anaeromonas frigoriresistens]MBS4538033.1 sulfurtransferase [Anaeromonas frigoriresistens]
MLKNKKGLVLVAILLIAVLALSACTKNVENTTSTNERGYAKPESIVTAEELKGMLDDVVVVDFTEKGGKYIPGAVKIERSAIQTEVDGTPGMNISKEQFEAMMSEAGIKNDDTVVIYDGDQELWASRVWWAMKVYGHENVKLLDGGIDAWISAEYETENDAAQPEATEYKAEDANEALVATIEEVEESFDNEEMLILDTRGDKEWNAGRIPGAVQLEWTQALNEDGTFKNADELKKLYEDAGVTADKVVIPHCKSGVRATHSLFVLTELLGYENVENYDGSWLEYEKSGLEIEK